MTAHRAMRIDYLSDGEAGRWDAWVGSRAASVSDLFAWRRIVRDAYGMTSHLLLATDADRTVGALALYEVRHPLFGHYLSTAVFSTDGGLLHETEAARDTLLEEAKALAARLGVDYVLIRGRVAIQGFQADARFRTAVVELGKNSSAMFEDLQSKTRNQVRRGMKEGFSVSVGPEQVPAFFDVFHRHMRELGSPGHGMPFYQAVLRHLGDQCGFVVIRDGNRLVGGALIFYVNGVASSYHAVTLREFNTRCPNYLLYWRLLELSVERGCATLDMGRAEADSSQLAFKENWSPRVLELRYNYHLARARELPRLDPRNPRYRLAIAGWKRMPLFVTRALGPRLISGIA